MCTKLHGFVGGISQRDEGRPSLRDEDEGRKGFFASWRAKRMVVLAERSSSVDLSGTPTCGSIVKEHTGLRNFQETGSNGVGLPSCFAAYHNGVPALS